MNNLRLPTLSAALLGVVIHSHVQAQVAFSLTAITDSSLGAGNQSFYLEPFLDADFFAGYQNVILSSAQGFSGALAKFDGFPDTSIIFSTSDYDELLNEIGFAGTEAQWNAAGSPPIPKWTLTLDAGLPSETEYQFGLFANDLASGPSPSFDLTPPDGATVLQQPTFQWDLIPGNVFTRIEFYPTDPSGFQEVLFANGETTWTPSQPLDVGPGELVVTQQSDVQSPPSVTDFTWGDTPVNGSGDLSEILISAYQQSLVVYNLTVVPEAREWALLTGLGLAGFALIRQRQRNR